MAVTYDSYDAKAIELAIDMLAASAQFQTFTGTASAAAAKAFIVEHDEGSAKTPPYALLWTEEADQPDEIGIGVYRHQGVISIQLKKAITSGDTAAEVQRRIINEAGLIAAQIQALFGTATTYLARGSCRVESVARGDENGANKANVMALLSLQWRTT